MKAKNCIFCQIINRELDSAIIYENDKCLVFNDINPQAKIHVLIIPKIHISSTIDINKDNIDYLSEMHLVSIEIAKLFKINHTGYRWVINTGNDGGQTVNHIHLHLLGGRKMNWPPG